jgi:hypothetical protein
VTENTSLAVEKMRKFVLRHLPKSEELLENASVRIDAEIRAPSGALRRKCLAKWTSGQDLAQMFQIAEQAWRALELEENWTSVEGET